MDKRVVMIPNYKIVDASLENVASEPRRRVVMKLELTYDTTPEKMKEAISILNTMPQTFQDISSRDVSETFSDFSDSALVITYIYFIKKVATNITEAISNVNLSI